MSNPTIIFPRAPGSRHFLIKYLNFCFSIFLQNRKYKRGIGLEKHRILPGRFKGKYVAPNVVFLTRREHTIAHVLLSKAFPDDYKLGICAYFMTHDRHGNKISSKIYESLEYYQKCTEKGKVIAESNKNRVCNYGPKISAALKGKPKSKESVKLGVERRKETIWSLTEEERKSKLGNRRGKTNSEESNVRRSKTISLQKWYYTIHENGVVETTRSDSHPGGNWKLGRKPR